jgi:uncharacterized membrane protein YidH (DUF202 family)
MAWQRTALGVGGLGALLLHQAGSMPLRAFPGALGLVVALALLLATERRYERTLARVERSESATSRLLVGTVSAATTLLSVSALVLVVLNGG